ncbi:MAG TPA: SHOCT domain-containing protein [Allosphingosinicella sp.]|nr:SHOCT domain-containing protein [Allosphingosinicella sp.]HYG31240.1 SHOCT domain-containing protein [Allosphingosinicella sp.]
MERTPIAQFWTSRITSDSEFYQLALYEEELVAEFGKLPSRKTRPGETVPWDGAVTIPVRDADYFPDRGGLFSNPSVLFVGKADKSRSFLARYPAKDHQRMLDFLQAVCDQQERLLAADKAALHAAADDAGGEGGGDGAAGAGGGGDLASQIREMAALHAQGVLTDEEFASAKRRLIG